MKKRTTDSDWWEQHRERFDRTDSLLKERIAYHDAKLREERPGWTPPQTTEEWQAYYEQKWAGEDVAGADG